MATRKRSAMVVGYTLFAVAFLNFAVYVTVASAIGGDAVNGKVENGKYYLANHGKYTEVSEAVFTYSRYHTYAVWITHPAGILGGLWIFGGQQRAKKQAQANA